MEARLQKLECEFRRSRRANRTLCVAIAAIVCFAGAQRGKPDGSNSNKNSPSNVSRPDDVAQLDNDRLRTVEANRFVLLDRQGRSRATMTVTDGSPEICLLDEKGHKRIELGQTGVSSGLRLFDTNDTPIVSLQLPHDGGSAHLKIRSPQGSSLTKASGFAVLDASDHGRLQLALLNGNFPLFGISQSGQTGPPSIEMTASGGSRSMKLHDANGHPLFSVHAADDGKTSVTMRHANHERLLQISNGPRDSGGPEIAFFTNAKDDGTGGQLPVLRFGFRGHDRPYIRINDRDGREQFGAPPG